MHALPPQDNHAAAAAASDGFDDEQRFSAPVRAVVARTVIAPCITAGTEDDECAGPGAVQHRNGITDETVFQQQSLILKEGWLCKLARFGRDMRRCARESYAGVRVNP